MLQERFAAGSLLARRFVDEARIAGQLQHPGIPPVHDLGTLPDGRPFLAMKLIKGRTLDELLRRPARPSRPTAAASWPSSSRSARRSAYAHAHGVIHRDLKPANVMVGAFGEVQVMDWGLAKVLAEPRRRDAAGRPTPSETTATEIRSAARPGRLGDTQAGSVLGTPAYMAAGAGHRGGRAGRRAERRLRPGGDPGGDPDRPAAVRRPRQPRRRGVLAAQGKLEECFARLDACGAEPELVALCKRCLSPERQDRPADAGEVAGRWPACGPAAEERARRRNWSGCEPRGSGPGPRPRRERSGRSGGHRWPWPAGVLGLLVVGGGGVADGPGPGQGAGGPTRRRW